MSANTSESKRSKRSLKKQRRVNSEQQLERFNSLPWTSSLPDGGSEDTLSLFIGSNELEGGFLTLEELDESEYGLEIQDANLENGTKKVQAKGKSKKRKASEDTGDKGSYVKPQTAEKNEVEGSQEGEKKEVKRKREKKSKKNKKKDIKKNDDANVRREDAKPHTADTNEVEGSQEGEKKEMKRKREKKSKKDKKKDSEKKDDGNVTKKAMEPDSCMDQNKQVNPIEDPVDEEEYYSWNELRLHPIIMRSIYKLKFKEPTPIQKACIPSAAHQGKDVIGAAETGSGKTLAFGLPILQRLLEEREKVAGDRISPEKVLRALVVTPTRELALQVTDHLKQVAKAANVMVVPIVGGMSSEKQERLLKARPEIVVGTPGRLWEIMSGGETHLVELHSLSFFVLDEADRMVEAGHFRELQSIIDMLPVNKESTNNQQQNIENSVSGVSMQKKKRQTLVFSATLALSDDFRKKLKRGPVSEKKDGLDSIETLAVRAGMRENKAIVDLTNASIMATNLVESVIECTEEEKDAYLYYILSIHGQGRAIVFCSSIAALRHISSFLRVLGINVWTLHSEMQQRARLKSVDRFRANEDGVLVATDAAARGLDIPGVRTVVHYQLPHKAEVYVHRCGRTARASTDGCSIALTSPNDASKFAVLCKSLKKESFQRFPVQLSYMPEIMKRSSLAHQIDKIARKASQEKAERTWLERNAESVELILDDTDSEEDQVHSHKQKKATSNQLTKLHQELNSLLSRPMQPKTLSRRFLAGTGVSPLIQHQMKELAKKKLGNENGGGAQNRRGKLVVIGQDCMEPLQALRNASNKAVLDLNVIAQSHKNVEQSRRKKKERKEMKKRMHEQRRKQRKKLKHGNN